MVQVKPCASPITKMFMSAGKNRKSAGDGSPGAFLFEGSILIMLIYAEDWYNKTGVGIRQGLRLGV